jgi:hypothetical protein
MTKRRIGFLSFIAKSMEIVKGFNRKTTARGKTSKGLKEGTSGSLSRRPLRGYPKRNLGNQRAISGKNISNKMAMT